MENFMMSDINQILVIINFFVLICNEEAKLFLICFYKGHTKGSFVNSICIEMKDIGRKKYKFFDINNTFPKDVQIYIFGFKFLNKEIDHML